MQSKLYSTVVNIQKLLAFCYIFKNSLLRKSYSRFQQTLHARVPNYIRKLTSGREIW